MNGDLIWPVKKWRLFLMNDTAWQERTDAWVKAQDAERESKQRKIAVLAILEKKDISAWARKYWNGVLRAI